MDPPQALDTRPGLPWLTEVTPLSEAPTETGQQLLGFSRPDLGVVLFFRERERAHVLRRPEAGLRVGVLESRAVTQTVVFVLGAEGWKAIHAHQSSPR